MVKRLIAISAVLVAVLALAVTPAIAAMGGLEAPARYQPKHPGCAHRLKHGKSRKCRHHKRHSPGYPSGEPQPTPINPGPEVAEEPHETREEPLEAKSLEVFESIGKEWDVIWGAADVYWPLGDEVTVRFLAKSGSFESQIYSGGDGKEALYSPRLISMYIPPQHSWTTPPDGLDEAWAVVIDHTKHTYAESEHVVFNFEEPEDVRYITPKG